MSAAAHGLIAVWSPSLIAMLSTFCSSSNSILRQLLDLTSNCLSLLHWSIVNMSSLKRPKSLCLHTLLVTTRSPPCDDNRICCCSLAHQYHCSLLPHCSSFSSTIPHCLRALIESTTGLLTKPLFILLSLLVLLFPFYHAGRVFPNSIIIILTRSTSIFPQLPLISPNRPHFDSTSSPIYTSCSLS